MMNIDVYWRLQFKCNSCDAININFSVYDDCKFFQASWPAGKINVVMILMGKFAALLFPSSEPIESDNCELYWSTISSSEFC